MPTGLRAAIDRVRLRKQPVPLHLVIAERIDQLNPLHWDSVTAHRGLFCSRDYHRMLERVRPANLDPRYVMVYRGERPVAAISLQWLSVKGDRLRRVSEATGLRRAADQLKQSMIERVSARSLEAVGEALRAAIVGLAAGPWPPGRR